MTTDLKQPLTNNQEVLYTLIKQKHVSLFDFPWLAGFRTRVSDLKLKYGVKMKTVKHQRVNKFGNTYTYAIHKIVDVEQAKKVYEKLTEKN